MPKYLLFKYLRFDKTQPFISLSALLAFLGVSIGLMVLIVAMAIMNGFDKEFERKLFTMNYPISVLSGFKASINDELVNELKQKFPDLKFSPFISTQVILRGQNSLEGGLLFGVNSADEKEINSVVKAGLNALELGDFEILVGNGLKDTLGINNGEKITAIFTKADPSGFSLIPKMKRFDVVAGFSSGLVAYDKAYSYTSVESLRKILEYPAGIYDGIHIYSAEPFDDIKRIQSALPLGLKAIGWWQQNGNFFSALQLEKRALFIVLMLIILVASLNIVSSLLMTVMNRRQEIALLLALGASKSEIKKSFFLQGFVIGGGGIIFGIILGLFGVWLLGNFNIINLPADVYGSSKLPMELSLMDFSLIVFGAILIVCISSYYPAKKASEVNILQTLRN
ncbi:membrane protein, partial [Campylobacter mucosalis]